MKKWLKDDNENSENIYFHDISRLMRRNFEARARVLKLTRSQWMVLHQLLNFPNTSQADLASRLEIKPITLTRLLDRLEQAGWLRRVIDSADRRIKRVQLTAKVEPLVNQIRTFCLETREQALQDFNQAEHKLLLQMLSRIKSNLLQTVPGEKA